MNVNPDIASTYRGKILISLEIWDIPKPVFLKEKMHVDEDFEEEIMEYDVGEEYELRCILYKAVALPWDSSEYSIKIKWLNIELKSSIVQA
mmetsp:Transcript_16350/g.2695  ORF Transcript_16350/g.2695 Transcript_16350/m.2695 type:complete len:91 (+) Transcript_16350:114-386(+)